MTKTYVLGLDYGTNSCRALIVDLADGAECATHVFAYPSGEAGILLDARDPNVARQNPRDYIEALVASVTGAIADARERVADFDPAAIIGIGVDTTGSTPIPVDASGMPLAFHEAFQDNLNAMAWLWKDHTAHAEAEEITTLCEEQRPVYLTRCGGTYSSEWFWSKLLHCRRTDPEVFEAAVSWVEHCDFIPALLAGNTDPAALKRSVCAAGHKALYSRDWKGLPDAEFLSALDPKLAELRERLFDKAVPSDQRAGELCAKWAERLGLKEGTPIAVGAFDAHMGAVGAGISKGTLVKILGTSTCDLLVMPDDGETREIPGVCGLVSGSILPDYIGVEAGQSAVGDIFLWFVKHLVPERYGATQAEKFDALETAASEQAPGAHGLLALDWNNGNRSILVDPRLSGLLVGQTLHTEAHEIYRALVEATAFGALTIINRIVEQGVAVNEVVCCGGLAAKNPMLMQIYADVTGIPMRISRSEQTCALGAAIFGAAVADEDASIEDIQAAVCAVQDTVYYPNPDHAGIYKEMYTMYRDLHDAFGTGGFRGRLNHVMKDLIALRERQRG